MADVLLDDDIFDARFLTGTVTGAQIQIPLPDFRKPGCKSIDGEVLKMADLHTAGGPANVIRRVDATHLQPVGIQDKVEFLRIRGLI